MKKFFFSKTKKNIVFFLKFVKFEHFEKFGKFEKFRNTITMEILFLERNSLDLRENHKNKFSFFATILTIFLVSQNYFCNFSLSFFSVFNFSIFCQKIYFFIIFPKIFKFSKLLKFFKFVKILQNFSKFPNFLKCSNFSNIFFHKFLQFFC
jgi:hypothetical protein